MISKSVYIIIVSFLISCTTPYQKLGRRGGYTDEKINDHVYRVSFEGNSKTSDNLVYQYFLRRSAEVALEHRFSYFLIIESNEMDKVTLSTLEGNKALATDPTIMNSTGVTNAPTVNKTLVKHKIVGKIALFKEGEEPLNALKVEDVLKDVKVYK